MLKRLCLLCISWPSSTASSDILSRWNPITLRLLLLLRPCLTLWSQQGLLICVAWSLTIIIEVVKHEVQILVYIFCKMISYLLLSTDCNPEIRFIIFTLYTESKVLVIYLWTIVLNSPRTWEIYWTLWLMNHLLFHWY